MPDSTTARAIMTEAYRSFSWHSSRACSPIWLMNCSVVRLREM